MLCIICGVYRYRQKQLKEDPHWQMPVLPRSRQSSRTNLRQLSPGPDDDSDTDAASTLKKSRSYDKVYRTNEPLPGKPSVDFPAKKWDLDDEDVTSSEGSENKDTKIAKDIQYINKTGEKPGAKQMGRRSLRSTSGTDQDLNGTALDEHDEDGHEHDDDKPPSPEVDERDIHGPLQHQYSPTFSGADSRDSTGSSMSYPVNAQQQNRFGGVPVLPNNTKFFSRPPSGVPTGATPIRVAPQQPLSQDSGLPIPPPAVSPTPSAQKSTEV